MAVCARLGVRYLPAKSLALLAAPGMTSGLRPRLRIAARTTGPGCMDGTGSLVKSMPGALSAPSGRTEPGA